MIWIVLTHLIDWWLKNEFFWMHRLTIMIFEPIGASGLLFISGISITLSYRNNLTRISTAEKVNLRAVRNSYLLKSLFFFIIALIYNFCIAIALMDPVWIWTWFILQTAALSLFIAWPLLKTSRFLRIFLACAIWIANPFIVGILLPYEGISNLYGVLFYILYHGLHQVPILVFFPFFLFGTVIGDTLFDTFLLDPLEKNKKRSFGYKFLIPAIVIGTIFIIFGVLFKYPKFLMRESFSWVIYSLGIEIILISILLSFEVFDIIKTKKSYKLLFYYSYYSLTIFLAHNILHFLFLQQLDIFYIWLFAGGTLIFISMILRIIYKRWQGHASIKVQIGKLSHSITMKNDEIINGK